MQKKDRKVKITKFIIMLKELEDIELVKRWLEKVEVTNVTIVIE